MASSDIGGVEWSIECTRTAKGIKCLPAKWAQAVRNALLEDKHAVVVALKPRQRLRDGLLLTTVGCFLDLKNERDRLREGLERLVADLETNSERGAPDYAHEALRKEKE